MAGDAKAQAALAQDRLQGLVLAIKEDRPEAALAIAQALGGQVIWASFSIAASLESIAESLQKIAKPLITAMGDSHPPIDLEPAIREILQEQRA